ncbi:c6 zinc finger domain containing protein [Grosmannia clavigera kw1407]|uniref:C6 zinc finger domain containing protein n=1 Tax=Grosmannia clavigera (strain kw1407 / UAMH 11150) TaxID=655863 RepID=F0XMW3_GROCL|nr:c6 zinc finger domain containing protein [Grosmannia clavigera kw1407]EFX00774.1 c6 zinc finger domain containing protein [Grosmannia clavigera kw1407]
MSDTINASPTSRVDGADELADETQHDGYFDRVRKRKRSLRKGTHSCWACKRRKEKCSFDNSDVCTGCLRRGTRCVSQQFADDDEQATSVSTPSATATAMATATASRLQRIEDMVVQLTYQIQNLSQTQSNPLQTPATSWSPSPAPRATLSQTTPPVSTAHSSSPVAANELIASTVGLARIPKLQMLSQTLHGLLPCHQDIQLLRKATARHPVLSTLHITMSYATLRRDGIQPTDGVLREPPLVTSEPVLIAKYMLQVAVFLQEMQPAMYPELRFLVEPAVALTERCANTAMSLVTRQDELLGCIESLECVVLESVYQCNSGRLRLSWMAVQRAMLLARTMGLHLTKNSNPRRETLRSLDSSSTRIELPNIWFRIVHYDLQLSRMLGLPPGAADVTSNILSPYDMAVETPEGYLEKAYRHVMVLALAQRSSGATPPDVQATQALDQELQRAANSVPCQWWLPPNLAESSKSALDLFWDMRRLLVQMLHHDLRNQLYVPYMLAKDEADRQRCEMARIACVNSSREVLSRFILLRHFNWTASSCRIANFLGLMAAITLVLAHLGGSRRLHPPNQDEISFQVDSLLSHQALSDRAMIEQALETMRRVSHSSEDALCAQSADVLHRLLDIEASGNFHIAEDSAYVSVEAQPDDQTATSTSISAPGKGDRIFIPYFGDMRIMRPNNNKAAHEISATTVYDAGAGAEAGCSQTHDAVDLVDPLLLDLRDEDWMSQNIDMTFLDAFLEGTT